MNGAPNGSGELVVKVNTTYLRLFQTIAGGVIALVLTVGAFIVRVEVNAATMHSDVANMLDKIAAMQTVISRSQEAISNLDARVWQVQAAQTQAAFVAEGERQKIVNEVRGVKDIVEERTPEPTRRRR